MGKIVERIEREAGTTGLVSILGELAATDLQSLQLDVYRARSRRMKPSDVLSHYESNRFVRPSSVSPRSLLRWEQLAYAHLPTEFQPIALSPVCPLGACSAVAPIDQNWAVATVRNTEVVSDSTNVLALECALRRRDLLRAQPRLSEAVHLATSHRLLRAQRYESPRFLPHFSSFALCSAGRDRGNMEFELAALRSHARFYLATLRAFLGPTTSFLLSVTDLSSVHRAGPVEDQLLSPIRAEFEGTECMLDQGRTSGRGYYRDLCFHVHAAGPSGRSLELVDGGCVDWTRKLLGSAKERLVVSGIGVERLCTEFENG